MALTDEIEVGFQTYPGYRYQLAYSPNLIAWIVLPKFYEGDGTLKSEVFVTSEERRYWRVLQHTPKGFDVVTAWDGSYVLLERKPHGPGDRHRIYRDNQLLGTIEPNVLSFKDSPVPAGSHTYSAEIF